jgi:serine protease Do
MKQYLLKIAGLATLLLFFMAPGFAQQGRARAERDTLIDRSVGNQEVVLLFRNKKDSKVTVEMKDGKVLVNGKPVTDFKSDDLTVSRPKRLGSSRVYAFSDRDGFATLETLPRGGFTIAPPSPFRSYSYDGGDMHDLMGIGNEDWDEESSKHGFLGVSTVKTNDDATDGAKISGITEGGAAEKAGLKEGDLITKIDDKTIEDPSSLSNTIRKYKPEDKVTVTFKRDGKEQKVTATLGKAKGVKAFGYGMNYDGMKNFNFDMAPQAWSNNGQPRLGIRAQDTEDGKGVKVLDVDDESAAEKAGIKEGDIITRFDGKDVNSAGDLATNARESKGKPSVKVDLLRDGKAQTVELKTPRKLKTADL